MDYDNEMTLSFRAVSANESFARVSVAAFALQLDPAVSEITEIKTAVSEAVTNSIIHAYDNSSGIVHIWCGCLQNRLYIEITDNGKGIENVSEVMEPLYTSKPEQERSGLGFTIMESFMDKMEVYSEVGKGTKVVMEKNIGQCVDNG